MAKLRKNGIKIVLEKLQRSLSLGKKSDSDIDEKVSESDGYVPAEVKEGHFAVIAEVDGQEPQRFVVPLKFLTHPPFLRLLEQAAEEYGFDQEGALTIPCRPSEIERILEAQAQQWRQKERAPSTPTNNINAVHWGSSSKTCIAWLRVSN